MILREAMTKCDKTRRQPPGQAQYGDQQQAQYGDQLMTIRWRARMALDDALTRRLNTLCDIYLAKGTLEALMLGLEGVAKDYTTASDALNSDHIAFHGD